MMFSDVLMNLRWKKFPVLNDGFVTLVDVMGDDLSVVQAARVSYGRDTRADVPEYETVDPENGMPRFMDHDKLAQVKNERTEKAQQADRKLLRYLMRHHHTTPFEMAEVKLLVRCPMDCWRQWIRHRTACLAGDTELHFDLPGGIERRGNQLVKMTIAEVFRKFQPTKNEQRPDKQRNPYFRRDRIQAMRLRCLNEVEKRVTHTNIVDVWESGVKTVYEVTTESGIKIKMSKDHQCYSLRTGWHTLKYLAGGCLPKEVGDVITPITNRTTRSAENVPFGYWDMCAIGPGSGTGMARMQNRIDPDTEEWASVVGWEDYYEVSTQGRVRRVIGGRGSRSFGRCKQVTISEGRAVVSLNRPGEQVTELVHRLMAIAFMGPPEDGQECCHNDGNSLNNVIDNLRWDSAQSNADDRVRDGATTVLGCRFERIVSIRRCPDEMTYDIEVAGEWHNFSANGIVVHNSVNEYSTRYTTAIDSAQATPPDEWRLQSKTNKQGSSDEQVHWPDGFVISPGDYLSERESEFQKSARELYEERLTFGIAREQARKDLPLSTYTEAYWKCDLHNLLHFLRLRMDSHAQLEIRQYATIIGEQIIKPLFPCVWEAFEDYRLQSMNLTRLDIVAIGMLQNGADWQLVFTDDRERQECFDKLVRLKLLTLV